jgi:hypothetical protein
VIFYNTNPIIIIIISLLYLKPPLFQLYKYNHLKSNISFILINKYNLLMQNSLFIFLGLYSIMPVLNILKWITTLWVRKSLIRTSFLPLSLLPIKLPTCLLRDYPQPGSSFSNPSWRWFHPLSDCGGDHKPCNKAATSAPHVHEVGVTTLNENQSQSWRYCSNWF